MLTQQIDPIEGYCWGFKIFGYNKQLGYRPFTFRLEEITLSCKAYSFRSVNSKKKAKRYKYWSKRPKTSIY